MGSYGIGLERILSSAVELYHDEDGICWPVSIAPYTVVLTPINYKDAMRDAADRLHDHLAAAGIDTILDDRAERPGVKFKDADLIGIPYRVVIGGKLKEGKVELFERASRQTELVDIESLVETLQAKIESATPKVARR